MRRRCSWCAVVLSWWQLNNCRRCGQATRLNAPSPSCHHLSRADEPSDRFPLVVHLP